MERHPDTLGYYDANASGYAAFSRPGGKWIKDIERFRELVPEKARVLDLGCGAGHLAKLLIDHGFDVTMIDGSRGLAAEAEKLTGRTVRVQRFQDLEDEAAFDGIWAAASLLHVPNAELPDVLARVGRALVSGGIFYASFKEIGDDLVDSLGRLYTAMSGARLKELLESAGFELVQPIGRRSGMGADGVRAAFIHAFARKLS